MIEAAAYLSIPPEAEAVLRSKHELSPATCLVGIDAQDKVQAYCLSHPYPPDQIPALNTLSVKTEEYTNLFIHDLAVRHQARRLGFGQALYARVRKIAQQHGFSSISLVAVEQAGGFWAKMGFRQTAAADPAEGYAAKACFMQVLI